MLKTFAFSLVVGTSTAVAAAFAQTATDVAAQTPHSAYVQDGRGVIVRSGSGLCWRTSYWTPADAVLGCDGDLAPPVVSPIAPPIVSSAPKTAAPIAPAPVRCDFAMTLESDQTFSFNSANLSIAAKRRIDTELRGKLATCAAIDSIVVTGYTDRLGPDAYNQKLSVKRAETIAGYLKNAGVTAPIDRRGMGNAQAVKACAGIAAGKKLIECLAPNRRVVIEVYGASR
jgi:OOP family OmpA-OmpF porin